MRKIFDCLQIEKNSKLVLFGFYVTLIFQLTAFKYIWSVENFSRIINFSCILLFSGYATYDLLKSRYNKNLYIYYIIPGLLIYFSYFINISLSSISDFNIASQFGRLIPWAIYLSIPGLLKFNNINKDVLWKYFYKFMLITTTISIAEYFFMLFEFASLREIKTPNGNFLAGFFSIFYELETGDVHQILYGPFMEPGTLAMLLLPVMTYAFFQQKYISLIIFLIALYLTNSLGGIIGLCMLAPFLIYFKLKLKINASLIYSFICISLLVIFFGEGINERYQEKNLSRETREVSVLGLINEFPVLMVQFPFGMPIGDTLGGADIKKNYFGSNFTPGNAFYLGGILSFFGYLAVLFVSMRYAVSICFYRTLSIEEKTVIVSIFCLLPFIVQREVIWDNGLFPFLFSPFIISYILNKKYEFGEIVNDR